MSFFDKKPKSGTPDNQVDFTNITRVETIEGFSIPGIIKNMQYHFTNLQIYSDGLIDCWGMVDLSLLKDKIINNWVVTSIPDGQAISIFSVGHWVIDKGQWTYNKDSFYKYVYSLIKKLNPTLENLHNYHGSNSTTIGKVNVAKHSWPTPKPFYNENPDSFFRKRISGEKFNIFFRNDDGKTYMVELSIYQSGIVEITNLPQKKQFRIEELKELLTRGQLTTELKAGEFITILGLGSFAIVSGQGVDSNSKYNEILDKFNELNGQENTIAKCRRIFEEYMQNPTTGLRQELKEAYEMIPEHQRMFVGTMDTKDHEVRRAIYGHIAKKE